MTELQDLMHHRLKIENMREAVGVIDPVSLNTPQYYTDSLSKLLGGRLIVKVETANPIRSFKGRGAEYLTSKVTEGTELITASAGNFGQAMAYACSRRALQLTVYASVNANPFKLARADDALAFVNKERRFSTADQIKTAVCKPPLLGSVYPPVLNWSSLFLNRMLKVVSDP